MQPEYTLTCWQCDQPLNPAKAIWLFYDPRSKTYSTRQVAKEFERGCYAFCEDHGAQKKAEHARKKGRGTWRT